MRIRKYKAFTLAEVLVVIAVLGFIAAVTIPNLLYGYDEKQLNTRWKKEYNVAVNAVKRIIADKGEIDFSNNSTMRDDFENVMKFASKGLWRDLGPSTYRFYESSTQYDASGWTEESALMLDSSVWRFVAYTNNCTGSLGSLTGICGQITVDVNATNPPNQYGKDLYFINIATVKGDYRVYPYGASAVNDNQSCVSGSTAENTSRGCSALALINTADFMP